MEFRHEWKHELSPGDLPALRSRLRAVAAPDEHGENGAYRIRSLYFDTPTDRALREKIDGVARREKFRLRRYGGGSLIRLEKKSKLNGLCAKEQTPVTEEEVRALLSGDTDWMRSSGRDLVWELHQKMNTQLLRPRTIVDYTREDYVFGPGNVRVTKDWDIRTGLGGTDFLDFGCVTVPAGGAPAILEVKWDEFLPSVIQDAVQLNNRRASAFSKYAACRVYG